MLGRADSFGRRVVLSGWNAETRKAPTMFRGDGINDAPALTAAKTQLESLDALPGALLREAFAGR